jgi:hypothetical protein
LSAQDQKYASALSHPLKNYFENSSPTRFGGTRDLGNFNGNGTGLRDASDFYDGFEKWEDRM